MARPLRKDDSIISFQVPRRLAGKRIVLVDESELVRLRERVTELEDVIGKIRRGERELREGKTRIVKSLADLRA